MVVQNKTDINIYILYFNICINTIQIKRNKDKIHFAAIKVFENGAIVQSKL